MYHLPPLRKFAAPAESPTTYTTDVVLRLQRRIARKYANGHPQRFYSIREVATHFKLPRIAIARMFDRLKAEGLLTSSWGSQTTLQPRNIDRALHFRGLIAQLVSVDAFKDDAACQKLVKNIEDQLWQQGFAYRTWFYDNADDPEFCDQLIVEQPDLIIWLTPGVRVSLLGQRLMNCGIPVVRGNSMTEVFRQLNSCGV